MSDEQREKEQDRARENRLNFSQEQREKEQDRARENRLNFSEAQGRVLVKSNGRKSRTSCAFISHHANPL